jgi:flagellar basal body P-ring formation protein FlgA
MKPKLLIVAFTFACSFLQHAKAGMVEIPVPIATLQAGQRIGAADLSRKSFYVSDIAANLFVTSNSEVEGRVAKRALVRGKPIALFYLQPLGLVEIGVPTKVTIENEGISISATLIPIQSGVAGQLIDARNPESGKVVRVIVTEDGHLQVPAS